MDSETDTNIIIGSGYCCDFNGFVPITRTTRKEGTVDLSVKIMNGNGGHSALAIHKNIANTVTEMFNIIKNLSTRFKFQLIDIKTTQQLNLIPPHCEVVINLEQRSVNQFKKAFLNNFNNLLEVYKTTEKHLTLIINAVKSNENPLTYNDTNKLINLLIAVNNGLNNFNSNFNIASVSTNLGQITMHPNEVKLG
jgi:ATP adenylyltransferase/5',5'''-P-1,P-4-tetraphosphate phosphorylase II